MNILRVVVMGAALMLLSESSLWACGSRALPAPQQYVPQTPQSVDLASVGKGVRMAGAGLGGALLAATVTWSLMRRRK